MKVNPEQPSTTDILKLMMGGSHHPVGDAPPLSDDERARVQQMIAEGHVRFLCIGCDTDVAATDALACACGGFVCPACRRTEEDGVCNHEPHPGVPHQDEEDDDGQ